MRLILSNMEDSLKDLAGLWTLAMTIDGKVKTNDGYPYYKLRGQEIYMWWMWHGPVGHWVTNDTPGAHGNDRLTSSMGDFECPQEAFKFEIAK